MLQFREFREVTLFDEAGGVVTTSRVGPPRVAVPEGSRRHLRRRLHVAHPRGRRPAADERVRRRAEAAQPSRPAGWSARSASKKCGGWWTRSASAQRRLRAARRAGRHARSRTATRTGRRSSRSRSKSSRAPHPRSEPPTGVAPVRRRRRPRDARRRRRRSRRSTGPSSWSSRRPRPSPPPRGLQRQLVVAIGAGLLVMVGVGLFFGRRFIAPIFPLQRATQGVAAGDLETRVHIDTGDEFGDLGQAFNTMADRLIQLQEDVKRQERQAMFGRVAAGLVHDLSHPDPEHRQQHAAAAARRRRSGVAQTRSTARSSASCRRSSASWTTCATSSSRSRSSASRWRSTASLAEIVDAMKFEGERNGVAVEAHYAEEPMTIEGDRFALGRVYRNLITNGIQATQPGGHDHRDDGARRRLGRGHRRRHRLGHPAGPAGGDLRGLRHDQAPRPRPRPGDLEADRGAARRHDHGRERSGQGHSFTLRFPARERRHKRRPAERRAALEEVRMFGRSSRRSRSWWRTSYPVRYFEIRTPRGSALQRRDPAGPDDRIILDDDSVTNLEARTARLVPATLYSRRWRGNPAA